MHVDCVAEIAQAHDGSVGILHSFIDALAETGIDAIKFQMHYAEAESSAHEPFRVNFSRVDDTRFNYWKRMELTPAQWHEVKNHCDERGVEFLVTPFSLKAVGILETLGVKRYKIGSGDILSLPLLEAVCRTGKEVVLSTGLASIDDIRIAVEFVTAFGNPLKVLQCTSEYPTPPERTGLSFIPKLAARFGCPVGLSDHSGTPYPSLAAVALGATFIEFHAAFDRRMFGPDARSSLLIDEIADLVRGIRFLERALAANFSKEHHAEHDTSRKNFGRSLALAKPLRKGDSLSLKDIEVKKPAGMGIPASEYRAVLNKVARRHLEEGSFLSWDDFEK
jgi:N,N'-diacetyllegionaminate synthase